MPGKTPPPAPGSREAAKLRVPETRDIAERLAVVPPGSLTIRSIPFTPLAAFNPSMRIQGDTVELYIRVVAGYYTYTSMIARTGLELQSLLEGSLPPRLEAAPAVLPGNTYDFWGAEDPRVYSLGGELYMTYTGRTRGFFKGEEPLTLPVTAVLRGGRWEPVWVYAPRPAPRMDKDAFAAEIGGVTFHMHRPEWRDRLYVAAASRVERAGAHGGVAELVPRDEVSVEVQAGFEERVGWSAPPVEVEGRVVALLHGVAGDVYRVFAVELSTRGGILSVEAVTPRYIMEPREPYEVYGDRPYTVFPCGAAVVDDKLLVSYGAGDLFSAIAAIDVSELLSELDRGRVD